MEMLQQALCGFASEVDGPTVAVAAVAVAAFVQALKARSGLEQIERDAADDPGRRARGGGDGKARQ